MMYTHHAPVESGWTVALRASEPESDARSAGVTAHSACVRRKDGFQHTELRFSVDQRCIKPTRDHERMKLFLVTERLGAPLEARAKPSQGSPSVASFQVGFVPADTELWMYSHLGGRYGVEGLAFDADSLEHKLSEHVDRRLLLGPRLCFSNERIHGFARLLQREIAAPSEMSGLYADSALVMLLIELLRTLRSRDSKAARLSRGQLARVLDYLDQNLSSPVRVSDLSALTGLSASYFCQAFRASTGAPPHRWQMQQRIRRAQQLMLERDQTLTGIALAVGFADQPHFTRTFRRFEGSTPMQWLRERTGKV